MYMYTYAIAHFSCSGSFLGFNTFIEFSGKLLEPKKLLLMLVLVAF